MEEARPHGRARGTVIAGRIVTGLVVFLLLLDAWETRLRSLIPWRRKPALGASG